MQILVYSNNYQNLNILQKKLQNLKSDEIQFIFIDDIKILIDLLKDSQESSLCLILDFENENIRKIRDFAYECIKFSDKDIKCILLPAKRFNICHQKIDLVHFVRKGKIVASFDELINEALKVLD